jgi:uncharacterized metal-binding protein YceD (DUF177 family)
MKKKYEDLIPPDQLPQWVHLSKMAPKRKYNFELKKNHSWVNELREEVSRFEIHQTSDLEIFDIQVTLEKRQKPQLDVYLTVHAHFKCHYETECVKTLDPVVEVIKDEFKAVFLSQEYEKSLEYADQTSTFLDGEEMELYFADFDQAIDIKELFHEMLHLRINPYPLRADLKEEA